MNGGDWDMRYNIIINYNMDYLFGGQVAFASRLAANTASANASTVVYDATRTQLNALLAAGLPITSALGKRKKRLVSLLISKKVDVDKFR